MPKVVSRSTIVTDYKTESKDESALTVYYCWCGQIGLIVDCKIHKLPLRPRDGARVLDPKRHNFKLSCLDSKALKDEEIAYVKWSDTEIEKQYRYRCRKCKLWTFYKHSPDSDVVFIVKRAMNVKNPLTTKVSTSYRENPSQPSTSSHNPVRTETSSSGRFASVTITTLEEEEAEAEAKEVANSYELNATIVQRELDRQKSLNKRLKLDD